MKENKEKAGNHYVVGDIHGCFDEWMRLKENIESIDKDATFILLGDIIDRGPKTFEMIEWATRNITLNGKYQMLLGNHEDMIIQWIKGCLKHRREWGGDSYLATNYGFNKVLEENDSLYDAYLKLLLQFLEKRPLYKYVDISGVKFLITHAYAPHPKRMEEIKNGAVIDMIDKDEFIWTRVLSNENYPDKDVILVHGHTPTITKNSGEVTYSNNVINIDCGSVFRYSEFNVGKLIALRLEDLKEFSA